MYLRDLSVGRRWALICWGAVFVGCAASIWQVAVREFDMGAAAAPTFALLLSIGLTMGTWLVHDSFAHITQSRYTKRFFGFALFAVTWVMVFLINTSNAFFTFTHREAIATDVRDVYEAFATLDKRSTDIVSRSIKDFETLANQAQNAVVAEINNNLNMGWDKIAQSKLDAFNAFVGSAVLKPSTRSGRVGLAELPSFVEQLTQNMNKATADAKNNLSLQASRIREHVSSPDVISTRASLKALLKELDRGRASDDGTGALNNPERVTKFLERAFAEYAVSRASVNEILKDKRLAPDGVPKFVQLEVKPYSSDLKVVGRIFDPKFWSRYGTMPIFWAAVCLGFFVDLM